MSGLSFALGALTALALVGLYAAWPAITEAARRAGWTWRELRRPIAWDGPLTDGFRFWDHGHGWREPKCKMVWPSATGRKLTSYGNKIDDFQHRPNGVVVFS